MLVLDTNLKITLPDGQTRGTTQYVNYGFNSFARVGDRYLGAKDDGLFELVGSSDNGTEIDAYMELPLTDLGADHKKRARFFYLGYEADGDLLIRAAADQEASRDYKIRHYKDGQQTVRVAAGRNQKGRWWQIAIHNVRGSDFSVDSLKAIFVAISKGIRRN